MFLLVAGFGVTIALGLWRLHRWARWLAILVAMIGVVMLLPSVSSAMLDFRIGRLAWGGLGNDPAGDDRLVSISGAGAGSVRREVDHFVTRIN